MSHLNVDFLRLIRSERAKSCFVTKVRAQSIRSSMMMEFKRIFIFQFQIDYQLFQSISGVYQAISENRQKQSEKNLEIAQPDYITMFRLASFLMQRIVNEKNGFCQITVRLMLLSKILKKANNKLYSFLAFSQITGTFKNNAVFMEITSIIDFFMLKLRLYTIPASNYLMSLTCQGCIQRQRQVKVIEVELQFEIKKLTEDMALQKVKLQLAHQKEVRKWAERLNFNKNERQLENKSWMEKYDAMTQLYEQKLIKTETACQLAVAQAYQKMTVAQKNTIQQSQARICKEVEQIKRETEDFKRKLISTKEEQKKYLLKIHEQELAKQTEKHKVDLAVLKEQKQELKKIISGFESAERTSRIVNVQISEQLLQKKMEIQSLKEKIRTLQHRIKFNLEAEILNKDKQIVKIKAENEQACCQMANDFVSEKEKIIKEMNEKTKKMLEKEYVKCIEFQNKLKALDEQRLRQISLYQQQLQSMKITVEERLIPKSQFHEQISTLKGRLTSKEKDIQRAKEQIKQCKLEIQNNEQILTKFFKTTTNYTHTAPDIFVNTPKKKDYKIKKNRASVSGAGGMLDVPGRFSNVTSMESLDKLTNKDFDSFRIL